MSAADRRREILTLLCQRRHDTYANLAAEFGVTTRTIQNDIRILACSYPVDTVRGRYDGGIKIADWFHLNDKRHLTAEQLGLLDRLRQQLQGDDLHVLDSIIVQFGPN